MLSSTRRIQRESPGDLILQVQGLRKSYGPLTPVADVSFDIREGEVFGLLGPNGAGKTTTISMLSTELPPSAGDALLCGHSICREPWSIRHWIGVVPEDIALYPRLTAAENLRFFGRIYGVARSELENRIGELLHLVGLEGRRDDYVAALSGGMKRRLNLTVALIHRPKLILLDEPTVGLDPYSREQIVDVVHRLRESGSAILHTTHDMEEAQILCDRIGIINHGRLIAIGTLESLLRGLEYTETIQIAGLTADANLSEVRAAGEVCHIDSHDEVVRLFVRNAESFLAPLQKLISSSKQPVRVTISPPSLEQVFLRLTSEGSRR